MTAVTRWTLRATLGGLLLSACFLRGSTWLKVHDQSVLPFDMGAPQTALWVQSEDADPEYGYGVGFLLLIDQDVDCDEAIADLSGYGWLYGRGLLTEGSGVLGYYAWYSYDDEDVGYEGLYISGGYGYTDEGRTERRFIPIVFGDEQLWYSYGGVVGSARVDSYDDDVVTGSISTDLLDAGFRAENCGTLAGYYDDTYELESMDTAGAAAADEVDR